MSSLSGTWLRDPRGNPSPWIALSFAVLFGVGAIISALLGNDAHVTGVLAWLFLIAFNAAFNRPGAISQVAHALGRPDSSGDRRSEVENRSR